MDFAGNYNKNSSFNLLAKERISSLSPDREIKMGSSDRKEITNFSPLKVAQIGDVGWVSKVKVPRAGGVQIEKQHVRHFDQEHLQNFTKLPGKFSN